MEQEMGVPKNNLVCQAIFTLARLNGYMVCGQVSLSPVASEPTPPDFPGPEKQREAPSSASRASEAPPKRTSEAPPSKTPETSPKTPSSREEASEAPLLPSQHTSPKYASSTREEINPGRRGPVTTPPPMPTPLPMPYLEEEAPTLLEATHTPEEEAHEEEDSGAYPEAKLTPLTLYIEIPGEEAVAMEGDEFIIGRGKTCDFVIDSNRVSRQHARIIRDGNDFTLEDLNSSNGTFFGKQREKITRRTIADGDEFIFGTERVTFYIQ
jgi:hypothetical protein